MCLTQGNILDCDFFNQAGGENKLYLMPCSWLDLTGFTIAAGGDVSGITVDVVASGGVTGFYVFDLETDRNGLVEEVGGTKPNTFITQTVTAVIPKMTQGHRNVLEEWRNCRCGMVGVFVDNNCVAWLLGMSYNVDCDKWVCNGLRVEPGSLRQTGIDPTADANENIYTLTATVYELARELTATIPTA